MSEKGNSQKKYFFKSEINGEENTMLIKYLRILKYAGKAQNIDYREISTLKICSVISKVTESI